MKIKPTFAIVSVGRHSHIFIDGREISQGVEAVTYSHDVREDENGQRRLDPSLELAINLNSFTWEGKTFAEFLSGVCETEEERRQLSKLLDDEPTLDADAIAEHAVGEINRRTKETPRSPILTDTGELKPAPVDKILCFSNRDYEETDKPYAYLHGLLGKVTTLRWNQLKAQLKAGARITTEGAIDFDRIYEAYLLDVSRAANKGGASE